MTNKKTTSGGSGFNDFSFSNLTVKWDAVRVEAEAQQLFETYKQLLQTEQGKFILLSEFCEQRAIMYQLIEAFAVNREVSSGAAKVSHDAVENLTESLKKLKTIERTVKTQGTNFSKRLEEIEEIIKYRGF